MIIKTAPDIMYNTGYFNGMMINHLMPQFVEPTVLLVHTYQYTQKIEP